MMTYLDQDLEVLADKVNSGKLKAATLVQSSLDTIAATNPKYNSILEINPKAIQQAQDLDKLIASGKKSGRLAGIPYAAKDNFLNFHTRTTAASNILAKDNPFRAPYQATVIEKLAAEGAIMVAKTNLDAFAHGSSTENSDFGPSKNPIDSSLVPGGSSGGSAVVVALKQAGFALGTDTGGSIRLPASFCGVVGLKPTYGLVSRYGVIAMASSTDVIGPLAKNVADASLILDIIAGQDLMDATSIVRAKTSYADLHPSLKGLKIGVIKEYMDEGVDEKVREVIQGAIDKLAGNGAIIKKISLPSIALALPCYYVLVPAEISSNLARYDGIKYGYSAKEAKTLEETYFLSRSNGFGAEAKRRIMIGTYVLSSGYYDAYYKKAQTVRSLLIHEFDETLSKLDLLIGPTSPTTAFKLGQKNQDPLSMYLTDIMTVATNLTGGAAISLPCGTARGLPVGIQLIAAQKEEAKLLSAAAGLEKILKQKETK